MNRFIPGTHRQVSHCHDRYSEWQPKTGTDADLLLEISKRERCIVILNAALDSFSYQSNQTEVSMLAFAIGTDKAELFKLKTQYKALIFQRLAGEKMTE